MRRKNALYAIIATVLICSCAKEQTIITDINKNDSSVILTAGLEQPSDTKTAIQSDGGVFWGPSEEIMVFNGTKSGKFSSTNSESATSATFKGNMAINDGDEIWALYPYNENAVFADGIITTTIPSEQVACAGTFARNTNVAVAHSTSTTLQFYNVCGGVRFSVTEEGINKVIFEGLDGEMIAGKVTIGFEDGLPVVQSVSNSSPFITLQAPVDQTFEVGKWYYIVALPGALANGYKIRFYKDDTYAKRISNKSVSIKRSIFGSIANADGETDYEYISLNAPTSKETILISDAITSEIATSVSRLINEEQVSANKLAEMAEKIDGVIYSHTDTSTNSVTLMQRDSVYVVVDLDNWCEDKYSSTSDSERLQSNVNYLSNNGVPNEVISSRKKALIASPFQTDGWIDEVVYGYLDIEKIEPDLQKIGFNVEKKLDDQVTLDVFSGNYLSQFDLVIIITHGCAYTTKDGNKKTALVTGLKQLPESAEIPNYKDYVKYLISTKDRYYAVPAIALSASTNRCYPNTLVYLGGCHTGEDQTVFNYFGNTGASACLAWTGKILNYYNNSILPCIIKSMCSGASLTSAVQLLYEIQKNKYDIFSFIERDAISQLTGKKFVDNVRLFDSGVYDLKSKVDGMKVTLSWSTENGAGDCSYQVFLNGAPYDVSTNSITITIPNKGNYDWTVVKKIYYEGYLVETLQSDIASFSISGSGPDNPSGMEAVDLGLSVKWASCNLGASKPEDYGDYYAWGEVETDGNFGWDYYKWGKERNTLTKYNNDSSYGTVDNKVVLDSNDDIAHLKYGGSWHIPTEAEWKELFEECNTEIITNNSKCILKVISRTNNNSIIIPAAGFYSSSNKYQATTTAGGLVGYYWSSSLNQGSPSNAVHARFIEAYTTPSINSFSRCSGFPIRPVSY